MHGGPPTRHLQSQQRPLSFVDRQSSISSRKLNLASPERVCHPAHKNSSVSAKTTNSRRWAICIVSTSAPGQPPKMHDMPPTKLLSLNKGAQSLVVGQSEVPQEPGQPQKMHGGPPTRRLQSQQQPLSFVVRQSAVSNRKLNLASPEKVGHIPPTRSPQSQQRPQNLVVARAVRSLNRKLTLASPDTYCINGNLSISAKTAELCCRAVCSLRIGTWLPSGPRHPARNNL